MTLHPLYQLPAEDAPLSEWCRPLSATLTTRRTSYFSDQMHAGGDGAGALIQKLRNIVKIQRKTRNTKVDDDAIRRMRRQGVPVKLIAGRLGVDQSGIYRVLKRVKVRSDG